MQLWSFFSFVLNPTFDHSLMHVAHSSFYTEINVQKTIFPTISARRNSFIMGRRFVGQLSVTDHQWTSNSGCGHSRLVWNHSPVIHSTFHYISIHDTERDKRKNFHRFYDPSSSTPERPRSSISHFIQPDFLEKLTLDLSCTLCTFFAPWYPPTSSLIQAIEKLTLADPPIFQPSINWHRSDISIT
jgi:hypothetical protein